MNTELSFLIELLLKHKLPVATKDLVAQRIKDVEEILNHNRPISNPSSRPVLHAGNGVVQAASTQAILDRNPDLVVAPVAVIAQTPAAVAAINSRQQAINESMNRKIDKETGRPRKF